MSTLTCLGGFRSCAVIVVIILGQLCLGLAHVSARAEVETFEDHLEIFLKEERLNNVVKLEGAKSNGYGLIIGRSQDHILVVTARHILHDSFVNDVSGKDGILRVRLYGFEEQWYAVAGRVYQPVRDGEVMDLAVIEVHVPRQQRSEGEPYLKSDSWREDVMDVDPVVGERLELAARVDEIGYVGGVGRIAMVSEGRPTHFDSLEGQPGQSGAPVASSRGFVGLYLGCCPVEIVAIADIERAIVQNFGRSLWELLPVEPRSTLAELCIAVTGGTIDDVSVTGPNGLVRFDSSGCGTSITGRHQVSGMRGGLVCQPRSMALTDNVQGRYSISCTVDVSGPWTALGQGYLSLRRVRSGVWHLEMTLPRNRGLVRGEVTGTPPRLFLNDGVLGWNTPISGSLYVEGSRLRVDLSTGTAFFEEVYSR